MKVCKWKFLKKLKCLIMSFTCSKCKKTHLNSCDDCDYTINTDCVEFTGDALNVEDNVKNGSSRTLTSIIELLDDALACKNRSSKQVTGDYTVIEEDGCKILLLDGVIDSNETVEYTITLPEDKEFYNKIIVIKDISETYDISGSVQWTFSEPVLYDFTNDSSSDSFNLLSNNLHKTLYLAFVKVGINYQWVVISEATPPVTEIVITDDDMLNGWVTQGGIAVTLQKQGNHIRWKGEIGGGDSNTVAFNLPIGFRVDDNFTSSLMLHDGSSGVLIYMRVYNNQVFFAEVGIPDGDPVDSGFIPLGTINYFNND